MRNWLRKKLGIDDLEGQLESFTQLRNLDRDAIRAIKDSADRNTQDMVAVVGDAVMVRASSRLRVLEDKAELWDVGMVRIATERVGELDQLITQVNFLLDEKLERLAAVVVTLQEADSKFENADAMVMECIGELHSEIENLRSRLSLSVNRSELQALFRLKAALAKTAKGKLTPAERAALEAQ